MVHINLVSEPNDSMGDDSNILKQLASMVEKIDAKLSSLTKIVESHTAILEARPSSPKALDDKKKGVLQEQGSAVKFSTEELSEVENLSGIKGSKGVLLQTVEAGIPQAPIHSCKNTLAYGGGQQSGFSGGPWPNRAVGRERGNRRKYGGGDWNVRPIGAAPHDSYPNFQDYRNSEC